MCRIIEKWRNKQKLLTKVSVTAFWPLATFTQDSLVITPQPSSAQPSPAQDYDAVIFTHFLHFIVFTTTSPSHKLHWRLWFGQIMGHFVAYRQTQKFFSVFWFDSFNTTDCHLCRCRISPDWFNSDIHRTNPRTLRGVKNKQLLVKIFTRPQAVHTAHQISPIDCGAAGKGDPRSLQRSHHLHSSWTME